MTTILVWMRGPDDDPSIYVFPEGSITKDAVEKMSVCHLKFIGVHDDKPALEWLNTFLTIETVKARMDSGIAPVTTADNARVIVTGEA